MPDLVVVKIQIIMKYYFSKSLNTGFDKAVEKVSAALKEEGFGILTEIDIKDTLKKKIDVDFKKYRILGACNPPLAHKALTAEEKIGLMLPCNVVVVEQGPDRTEVAAVDPVASMQAVDNPQLESTATEVRKKLQKVIETL